MHSTRCPHQLSVDLMQRWVLQDEIHNKITLSKWEILCLIHVSVPADGAGERNLLLWCELACLWMERQLRKQAGCFAGCMATVRHLNSILKQM